VVVLTQQIYIVFIWKRFYLRERFQLGMMFLHDQLQVCVVVVLQASLMDVCVCVWRTGPADCTANWISHWRMSSSRCVWERKL